MRGKRYGFVAVILLFSILLAGLYLKVTTMPVVPNQKKIGVTYMTMNNDFYKVIHAEIKKQADQRQDILYVRDPELDEEKQSRQIDFFVKQQVDVIVINPVKSDSKQIIRSLKRAKREGIKIVAVDTQIQGDVEVDSTIVSDNYRAGVLNAENMMGTMDSANILLLEHSDTISATQRIDGFLDTIKGHSQYRVVARKDTLGQTEVGMPEVREVIEQGTNFNVVMALNDRSALGALAAIKEKSLTRPIAIYGIDGSPDMKSLIYHTEDIQATVAQSPVTMGAKTAEVLYRLAEGRSVKKNYIIPVSLIDKTNIDQFELTGWQ